MFCQYCGKEIADDSKFCRYCGKQLNGSVGQNVNSFQQSHAQAGKSLTGRNKMAPGADENFFSRYKNSLICVAVILIVFIGFIAFAAGRSGSAKRDVSEVMREQSDPFEWDASSYDWDSDEISEKEQAEQEEERMQEFSAENTADFEAGQEGSIQPENEISQEETAGLPDLSLPPSADSVLLPDIGAYIGCNVSESGDTKSGNSKFLSYDFDIADKAAAEEIISLLKNGRYQLTLSDSQVDDYSKSSALISYRYYFSYTGTASVSIDTDWNDEKYHVFLLVNQYLDRGTVGLSYYYVKGFSLEDPGIRGTQVKGVGNSSGGTDGIDLDSGGVYIPEFAKQDCLTCGGSGDCPECGGSGYLYSSASRKEDRNCWKCNASGDCPKCGGSGKR